MAATNISGKQIADASVQLVDHDITTAGQATVTKIVQGTGITLSSTGVDSGTGLVTINGTAGSVPTGTGYTHITSGVQDSAADTRILLQDVAISRNGAGIMEVDSGTVGNFAQLKSGTIVLQNLTTPVAPTVNTVGTAGTTSYTYRIAARQADGTYTTDAGAQTVKTTGNATLDGSNYNSLSWTAVTGAASYDVWLTATTSGLATGKITNVTTNSYNHQGAAGDTAAYPGNQQNLGALFAANVQVGGPAGGGAYGSPYSPPFRIGTSAGLSNSGGGILFHLSTGALNFYAGGSNFNFASNIPLTWSPAGQDANAGSFASSLSQSAAGIVSVNGSATTKPGQLKAGTIALQSLATAGAPTVTPAGTTGAATWTYKIVAKQADGSTSPAGATGSTATGNATLTSGNNNGLTWTAVTGATSYDIYRTVAATSPTTLGKIGNATTNAFTDTGLAGDTLTAPATNTAGMLFMGGITSSFPAVKRNGTGIDFRLADDSAYAATQGLYDYYGAGSPEAAVTAPIGSIFHRTNGGTDTSVYKKESGAGNTGWVAIAAGSGSTPTGTGYTHITAGVQDAAADTNVATIGLAAGLALALG